MEIPQAWTPELVEQAVTEDVGTGDITTQALIPPEARAQALIEFKQPGILAGLFLARAVFQYLDPELEFTSFKQDGDFIPDRGIVAQIQGKAAPILTGERTALNFLQRLSGIATLTHQFQEQLKSGKTKILDTRKTIPTFRLLEKYAVKAGGGKNHRIGLYDAILIKNNHLKFTPSLTQAIQKARAFSSHPCPLEVEVENLEQLKEALAENPDIILLDNMTPEQIRQAVELSRDKKIKLEISGGISLENLERYADLGADYISAGCLTHSAKALDLHLKVIPLNE